jgi:hypothetical protein
MGQLEQGYAQSVQQVYQQSAALTLQRWNDVSQSLSSSMTSAFQGIWTHQQTLAQGLINAADQLVYKFVDMGAKIFQDWFMRQVGMTAVQHTQDAARTLSTMGSQAAQTAAIATGAAAQTAAKVTSSTAQMTILGATTAAHLASEAIKTGASLSGAGAQVGAAAAAGTAEVTTDAAVAAAGAYKSTVVIPFIGPVAAPAAAALALAAVLGFGALISSEKGLGEVGSDGLQMVHKKETILPAWIAEPMRKMFVSPRSSGSVGSFASAAMSSRQDVSNGGDTANFYYQPKHTNMGADLESLLRSDGRSLRKWFKNELRNGGLKLK